MFVSTPGVPGTGTSLDVRWGVVFLGELLVVRLDVELVTLLEVDEPLDVEGWLGLVGNIANMAHTVGLVCGAIPGVIFSPQFWRKYLN